MMDWGMMAEVGKWVGATSVMVWSAYKAARFGSRGLEKSNASMSEVVSEVAHEVKGGNGGGNLRSIIERIEEKTDEQALSLLGLHRSDERRNNRVEKLEGRVQALEENIQKITNKLESATEIIIKREER